MRPLADLGQRLTLTKKARNNKTIETANMAKKVNTLFIYVVVNTVFSLTIGMIIKYLLTETSGNSVFC